MSGVVVGRRVERDSGLQLVDPLGFFFLIVIFWDLLVIRCRT